MDWLRLFNETAFFVGLTVETIYDIRWFIVIMVIWYITFGTAFYIINLKRTDQKEFDVYGNKEDVSAKFVPENFKVWFLDAMSNQYELSLGEFQVEAY